MARIWFTLWIKVQFPRVFRRKFICVFLHLCLVICYINSKDSTQLIRSCVFFNFCQSASHRNDSQKDLWSIGNRRTEHFFMRFDRHCLELGNSGRNSHVVSDCVTLRHTAKAQPFKKRDIFSYILAATFVISANFISSFVGTCGTRASIFGVIIIPGFMSVWIVMWILFEYYNVWMWAIEHGC